MKAYNKKHCQIYQLLEVSVTNIENLKSITIILLFLMHIVPSYDQISKYMII